MKKENKKKSSTLDKLLLWVVVWWAVGSVVWAKMSNQKNRNKVKEIIKEKGTVIKDMILNKSEKKSFWHSLNDLFFKKK